MAEDQDLCALRSCAAGQQPEPGDELPEDQIQQSQCNGGQIMADDASCPLMMQFSAMDNQFDTHTLLRWAFW